MNILLLKLVREELSYTQKEIAEILGIKQALFSKYEKGDLNPPSEILKKIADIAGYTYTFFKQDIQDFPTGIIYHRKKSNLSAKILSNIEAKVRLRALDVLKISKELNIVSDIPMRETRTPGEMATYLRDYWNLGNEPIDNLVQELEKHNIFIIQFDFKNDKFDGFFLPLKDNLICIAVNTNKAFTPDRQRFTLAHELGHALMHRNEFPSEIMETEANLFASEFLMPTNKAHAEIKSPLTFQELSELKNRWKISIQSLLFRARDCKIISAEKFRNYFIFIATHGLKKNEPLCGLVQEKAILLSQKIADLINIKEKGIDILFLSKRTFKKRYPLLKIKGDHATMMKVS